MKNHRSTENGDREDKRVGLPNFRPSLPGLQDFFLNEDGSYPSSFGNLTDVFSDEDSKLPPPLLDDSCLLRPSDYALDLRPAKPRSAKKIRNAKKKLKSFKKKLRKANELIQIYKNLTQTQQDLIQTQKKLIRMQKRPRHAKDPPDATRFRLSGFATTCCTKITEPLRLMVEAFQYIVAAFHNIL